MSMLLFTVAFALDCGPLEPTACAAANQVMSQVNAATGTTTIADTGVPARLRTSAVYDVFDGLSNTVQAGECGAIEGTKGGTYTRTGGTWGGTWANLGGGGGSTSGTFSLEEFFWDGTYTSGSGFMGETFAEFQATGPIAGDRAGGYIGGRWIRTAGNNGVFVTAFGDCTGDPLESLDPWYGGGLAATPVTLQNATATFSQTVSGNWFASEAINGDLGGQDGWAVLAQSGHTAVFETSADTPAYGGGTEVVLTLDQFYSAGEHLLGCFELYVTDADRSTFADGLQNNGQIGSDWTALDVFDVRSTLGIGDASITGNRVLMQDLNLSVATYTVRANTSLTGLTGVRISLCDDPSLPTGGPGTAANGNIVLTELTMGVRAQ